MSVAIATTSAKNEGMVDGECSLYRFSVDQYHRMIGAGIFAGDERVEFLDGRVVVMSPIYPPHTDSTQMTCQMLRAILPPGWNVREQHSITLDASEPIPELDRQIVGTIQVAELFPSKTPSA